MITVFLAAVLFAASSTPAPAATVPAAYAGCPRENVRIIEESNFEFPENAHPTHERVRFLLDLGSDGRIRRTALAESSGDATIDAAAAKAVGEFRYAAPTAGCVSTSTVTSQYWRMPAEALASPAPDAAASSSPAPCAGPFVRPRTFPLPYRREAPGTAFVDVVLDASARVTAVHLVQSTGNKKTDYAATIAARQGVYVFERQPGCAPTATTYRLELTFR
jgi:outer membrane biosynthesis protein TonB